MPSPTASLRSDACATVTATVVAMTTAGTTSNTELVSVPSSKLLDV